MTLNEVSQVPNRAPHHERGHRGGLVFPILLIGIGIVFLLQNLGWVNVSIWDVAVRFWPVLLIAVGIDVLIGRRSAIGSLIGLLIIVPLIAFFAYLVPVRSIVVGPIASSQVAVPLNGATKSDVQLSFGAGTLVIGSAPEGINAVEGSIIVPEQEQVRTNVRREGDTVFYEARSTHGNQVWFPGHGNDERRWDIQLNPDVATNLRVDSGVGKATVDLSRTHVNTARLGGGIGELTLTLPRQVPIQARVDGGMGRVLVYVPKGMGLHVYVDGGIGGVEVPASYRKSGKEYWSAAYAGATQLSELRIDGGIGKVEIVELIGE
jgi:hypothetical protein